MLTSVLEKIDANESHINISFIKTDVNVEIVTSIFLKKQW